MAYEENEYLKQSIWHLLNECFGIRKTWRRLAIKNKGCGNGREPIVMSHNYN